MKTITLLCASLLSTLPAFAEKPTIESLALKIEALERAIIELKAELAVTRGIEKIGMDSDQHKDGAIVINVLKDGRIQTRGVDISDDDLVRRLKLISAQFEDQPVAIRGDEKTKYQDVVRVIDLCMKAGLRDISFATVKPTAESVPRR